MLAEFDTIGALLGFGAGCAAGYGFAMRVVMKTMIAAQVNPLKVQLKEMQEKVKSLTERLDVEEAFNRRIQDTIFGLDHDDSAFEGLRSS